MTCVRSLLFLAFVLFFLAVEAHPGHDHSHEVNQRATYLNDAPVHKRSIAHCAEKLRSRGNHEKMMKRRHDLANSLRRKRSIYNRSSSPISHLGNFILTKKLDTYLRARDVDEVLATDHHSDLKGLTADTDPTTLFTGNSSCILTPEVTEGPYCMFQLSNPKM